MSLFWKIQTREYQKSGPWVSLTGLTACGKKKLKKEKKKRISIFILIRKFVNLTQNSEAGLKSHAFSFPS